MYDLRVTLSITGGTIVTPAGVVRADVLVDAGRIVAIGTNLPAASETLDASGSYVLPGGVDPHCHLIDDLAGSSRAAALGGTTTALSFSLPRQDEHATAAFARARDLVEAGESVIDIGLHAMCYQPNTLHDKDLEQLATSGADAVKVFLAYPELGIMATGDGLFRTMRAAAKVGLPVQVHCEDGELIEALVEEAAAGGKTGPQTFASVRPPQLEDVAVYRALTIAALAEADCYITHLSSAGAVEHVRRARAVPSARRVLTEACVHHILLDVAQYAGTAAEDLQVAPPLRAQEHVDAVREALRDGTIDTVGSDHAQHRTPVDERLCPQGGSHYGIAGIGARVPLMLSWGKEQGIPIERLAHVLATGPARAFGHSPRKGQLSVGSDADLMVWDPEGSWVVDAGSFHDGTGSSPYVGRQVRGRITAVFLRGRCLARGGELMCPAPGRLSIPERG